MRAESFLPKKAFAGSDRNKLGPAAHLKGSMKRSARQGDLVGEEIDELTSEDWQKVNKSDKTDGMSKKAVKAYRKENPGSKLKTAVTKKPSKLKKGSKDANRRKSFCARMSGMKKSRASAKTKRDPDSPINKALRRWNCESIEEMRQLIETAEMVISEEKKTLKNTNPCWKNYKPVGTKQQNGHTVPNCVPKESTAEGWSQKYKNSINCSHPKGFSQKAHCAGKKKHNESVEMEMTCPECGMCQTHGDHTMETKQRLDSKCWKGYRKQGTKMKGDVRVNNCVKVGESWEQEISRLVRILESK